MRNVTVADVSITGEAYNAGGIAGYCKNGKIENCANIVTDGGKGIVSCVAYTGGIVGYIYGNSSVTGCVNEAAVSSESDPYNSYVGGIAGYIYGANVSITNCANSGTVTSKGTAGGIVGYIYSQIEIIGCSNEGDVTGRDAGGVAGYVEEGSDSVSLTNCTNRGNVVCATNNRNAGGIVGSIGSTTTTIDSCTNSGAVSPAEGVTGVSAGGIAGYISSRATSASISNSINTGAVTGETAGGVVGKDESNGLTTANCAWNSTKTANAVGNNDNYTNGVTGITDSASAVTSVKASITSSAIAEGGEATITFTTMPANIADAVAVNKDSLQSSDENSATATLNDDGTITVKGVSAGTSATISFSASLSVTDFANTGSTTQQEVSFTIPVTVTAGTSNPSDPSQPAGPDNSGGGGGCSAGFGALALLAIAPLALKRSKQKK